MFRLFVGPVYVRVFLLYVNMTSSRPIGGRIRVEPYVVLESSLVMCVLLSLLCVCVCVCVCLGFEMYVVYICVVCNVRLSVFIFLCVCVVGLYLYGL